LDAYYMYSESRQCVVKLHKVGTNPAKWDYCYYYSPCPFEEAVRIFASCKGRDASSLPAYKTNPNAFANV